MERLTILLQDTSVKFFPYSSPKSLLRYFFDNVVLEIDSSINNSIEGVKSC
jgi:hypothetical protein